MSCPFYGAAIAAPHGVVPVLMPSGGNQCALITGAHSPCRMEIEGDAPAWGECQRNPAVNGTDGIRE
jgi:hypothetical protein